MMCENCRFWSRLPDDERYGSCHGHCPAPAFDPESDGEGYLVSWPLTAYDEIACPHFAHQLTAYDDIAHPNSASQTAGDHQGEDGRATG